MAWQTLKYRWTSSALLLMHNGQMSDPLNKWAKLLKQISGKRIKTEADHEEMSRIEFMAGLYMGEDGPVIPTKVIEATVINAAKKSKEGPMAKMALYAPAHAVLEYDGPRDADALWRVGTFTNKEPVRVGNARVQRTRPQFETWAATVEVCIEVTLVNPARVDDWMHVAGTQIGVCDWRPKFGRFTSERLNGK